MISVQFFFESKCFEKPYFKSQFVKIYENPLGVSHVFLCWQTDGDKVSNYEAEAHFAQVLSKSAKNGCVQNVLTEIPLRWERMKRYEEQINVNFGCLFVRLKDSYGWNLIGYRAFNLLKPTGHVMHQQFNIQQLYVLPTLYLCVLYLSQNKQRLVPLTA